MKSKTKNIKSNISPSLVHAAAVLKVPKTRLQDAIRSGCDFVDSHNRVDLDKARAWLKRNPAHKAKGTHQLRETKLMQEIRKLKITNDAKERTLIPLALVQGAHQKFLATFLPALHKLLVEDGPAQIYGLSVPDIRVALKGVVDAVYTEAARGAEHFKGY